MDRSEFVHRCNAWAAAGTPFLFVIDFELTRFHLVGLDQAAGENIFFKVGGRSNAAGQRASRHFAPDSNQPDGPVAGRQTGQQHSAPGSELTAPGSEHSGTVSEQSTPGCEHSAPGSELSAPGRDLSGTGNSAAQEGVHGWMARTAASGVQRPPGDIGAARSDAGFRFELNPVPFDRYERAFRLVRENILHGNSFLLNLTFPTKLSTDLTLQQVFRRSTAPYTLLFGDHFVLFSPETFIKIHDGYIYSYPMKGTIDAAIQDAEKVIMDNEKEMWEHNTIVDLIRNDLSMVAKGVEVTRYRYIDRLRTNRNELLQVSSEIRGRLDRDWQGRLGEILLKLLPAGSVSGAPKKKTLEIIAQAEGEKRGYYTGIFGIFDGATVDSGVMIRYIERTGDGLQFRSGGGITGQSEAQNEYNEMIEKVYVPFI